MARITTQSGYSPEQPILAENLDFISHISISLITKADQMTTKLYLALPNTCMQVGFRPLSNRRTSIFIAAETVYRGLQWKATDFVPGHWLQENNL